MNVQTWRITWQIVLAPMTVARKADVVSALEATDTIMNFPHATFQRKLKRHTIGLSEDSYQPTDRTQTSFKEDDQIYVVS